MMTREEAINRIKDHMKVHHIGEYPHIRLKEALDMSITALRPVSREQAERMRGEWIQGGYACGEHEWECSKCHETEWRTSCSRLKFCPFCGAPMTDKAVEIVMERLEALHDNCK